MENLKKNSGGKRPQYSGERGLDALPRTVSNNPDYKPLASPLGKHS